MRAKERFEYRGYVIDVIADHHESGKWASQYVILKDGDAVTNLSNGELGLHATVLDAQQRALEKGRKTIDDLIGRNS